MAPVDDANNRATKAAGSGDADLAQAYRDLARGEQAATNLENNLTNLESRLDAILAALEANGNLQAPAAAKVAQVNESPQGTRAADSQDKPRDDTNGNVEKDKKDTT
ncbi:hypothetical protein FVEN_g10506 [Fusarium venenatum]|uniref:Uncharacterized protein n=1 Tax=Fusarium venenatum TaxID=56646 RepID=A0A2L2SUH2_9HYPO|nr:uncharacterized protein FVRRES_11896 [Fusarium venenatum]KAG8351414.1 hypothetical protein FVEN_g10506 [Fusarium venenatum]KAH6978552.1 hypothetical protein EDB82DRAFT_229389 [Fusarium venenatum]CEI39205.1 unnamed protein product [Fusarium venenatum]